MLITSICKNCEIQYKNARDALNILSRELILYIMNKIYYSAIHKQKNIHIPTFYKRYT